MTTDVLTMPPRGTCPACGAPPQAGWPTDNHVVNQLRLLNRIAQVAAGHLEPEHLLTAALGELDRYLPMHRSLIWLADEEGGLDTPSGPTVVLAPCGPTAGPIACESTLVPGLRLPLGDTPFASCLDGEARYCDLALLADEGPAASRLECILAEGGVTCWFAVPLRSGERAVGVLHGLCVRPGGFTHEQIQVLYLVADLLGPALSNCRLYARLRRAYQDLHQAQHQLIQAEKLRALGELAGGMAHEFNNSLCGVLGFLELTLCHQDLPATCREYLELARTGVQDAAHTVRRVQDFARQRRGAEPVQPVDLDALVRQTLEMVRPRWEGPNRARGATVRLEIQTQAQALVSGSPTELREVVTNLVFNAIDAMPRGGVVTVRTWRQVNKVFLAVSDTGVGIPEAVRQRLFQPFFTTKGEKGNGLGLSVTFGIVRRHSGDITLDSELGRGSTFTIQLPVAVQPSGEGSTLRPDLAKSAVPGLRILVVEDEESIRNFLAIALEGLGYRPRLTANGREALEALEREAFDLVLTDLGLPDLSGEDVARDVLRRSPDTPVLLLTGWADHLKDTDLPSCFTDILGKPLSIDILASAIARVKPGRDTHAHQL